MTGGGLGWLGIVRLGLVQTALGAIVVLTTSTINRVMIVELALPAVVPGLLVTLHYALQVLRPRWGYGSDVGGRRTPWILGGMAALAAGGTLAAVAVHLMVTNTVLGIAMAILAFTLIGIGVGAAGTSLLVLLAKSVAEKRRAAAATIVWTMMIAGFIVTAALAGHFLDPFSTARLIAVASAVSAGALLLTAAAVWGVESEGRDEAPETSSQSKPKFQEVMAQVWTDPVARRFSLFIFVSMLAYSAQDLILEPFAGVVFGMTPGQSTALSGVQNSGVLLGMILVGVTATLWKANRTMSLCGWTVGGCAASAIALFSLVAAAHLGPAWPLKLSVFALGFANGVFAVAAISAMFTLASSGSQPREGVRMGLFGASQAIAFGLGGLTGTVLVDLLKLFTGSPVAAYAAVFAIEACLFIAAAVLASGLGRTDLRENHGNPLILASRQQSGSG